MNVTSLFGAFLSGAITVLGAMGETTGLPGEDGAQVVVVNDDEEGQVEVVVFNQGENGVEWGEMLTDTKVKLETRKLTSAQAAANLADLGFDDEQAAGIVDALKEIEADRTAWREILQHLRAAVKAGAITEGQMKEMLAGLRKHVALRAKNEKDQEAAKWGGILSRIKAAVETDRMTREEAMEKLQLLGFDNKQTAGIIEALTTGEEGGVGWEGLEQHVGAAVKAGAITQKQAERMLGGLRSYLARTGAMKIIR